MTLEQRYDLVASTFADHMHAYWFVVNGLYFYHRPIYDQQRRSAWLVGQAMTERAESAARLVAEQTPAR